MSTMSSDGVEDVTLADRLVRAADELIGDGPPDGVTIDRVAAAAGVSRATAFRYLGKREDLIAAVALRRAAHYVDACQADMDRYPDCFDQLAAAFRFVVREVPKDLVLREFFVVRNAPNFDADVHDLAAALLKPLFEIGQSTGAIRRDVPIADLITWTTEQVYLAMQQGDRAEEKAVDRVERFLTPALAPRSLEGSPSDIARTLIRDASASLKRALDALD